MIGETVGSYTIEGKLGEGGMGVVYLARHSLMKRKAAVKVLRTELSSNEEIARRFINEATAAASIHHPGIVDVMDVGTHSSGRLFILMEFLEGESLADRIRRLGPLAPEQAEAIIRQTASALRAAHRAKIIHRDLKPDNLFVTPDPEIAGGERVKVLDFGIAKLVDAGASLMTRTGAMMGTPVYMSPEQCRGAGAVDLRTDLYSLGCIWFEMLVGRPPFVGEGVGDLISSHMKEPAPPLRAFNPHAPEVLEPVIARLLAKNPDERYASCNELIAVIDSVAAGRLAASAPASAPAVAPRPVSTPAHQAPSAHTTHSAAVGQVATSPPIEPRSSAPAPRRRWLIPGLAVVALGGAAIAAVVIATSAGNSTSASSFDAGATLEFDATRPVPALEGESVDDRVAAIISQVREAVSREDWARAETLVAAGLEVEPESSALAALRDQARRELANELRYGQFVAAVGKKEWVAVAAAFEGLDDDSIYKQRARAAYDDGVADYTREVTSQAKALARANSCKKLDKLARDAKKVSETAAEAIKKHQRNCKGAAASVGSVTPTPTPTPTTTTPAAGKSAEALVAEAKTAAKSAQFGKALRLCQQALSKGGGSSARIVCAIAACNLKNTGLAKRYIRGLANSQRAMARQICLRNGVTVD